MCNVMEHRFGNARVILCHGNILGAKSEVIGGDVRKPTLYGLRMASVRLCARPSAHPRNGNRSQG